MRIFSCSAVHGRLAAPILRCEKILRIGGIAALNERLASSVRWSSWWSGTVKSCLLLALALIPAAGHAEPIETEHLFGFTIGSDVGDVGDREIEGSATGRFAKHAGTYDAGSSTLSAEFVPLANLRTEFTAAVVSYDIAGVSGFADQRYAAFGGLSADIRYRILDRATAPFGFAIGAEPHWGRADEITGEPVSQYGSDFVAAVDWEIIPQRVVAAFNLLYQPETERSKLTGTWSQQSTAGVALAVMAQVKSGIFIGGEARYLRQYDGFGLDMFAGQGFFIGPTIYFKLSEKAWIGSRVQRSGCGAGNDRRWFFARPGQFRTPPGAAVIRGKFLNVRRDGCVPRTPISTAIIWCSPSDFSRRSRRSILP